MTTIPREEALATAQKNLFDLQTKLAALPTEKEAAKRAFDTDAVTRLTAEAEVLPVRIAAVRAEILLYEIEADDEIIREESAKRDAFAKAREEAEQAFREAESRLTEARSNHLNAVQTVNSWLQELNRKRQDISDIHKELGR
jgi:hypothetical protein